MYLLHGGILCTEETLRRSYQELLIASETQSMMLIGQSIHELPWDEDEFEMYKEIMVDLVISD
jgi:hypothetical protein